MERGYMEILAEEIRGKFDLILEGYATLNARIDTIDRKLDEKHELTTLMFQAVKDRLDTMDLKIDNGEQRLSAKIDAVAADLSAHRADTEVHRNYLVRE